MKILIIAHALRSGGGRATCTNILDVLRKKDRENSYFVLVPDQPEYRRLQLESPDFEVFYYRRRFGHLGRFLFDRFALKRMCREQKPDLVWAMGGLGLINPPCTQFVSIQNPYVMYDSSHTGPKTLMDALQTRMFNRHFRKQLPKTSLVFCQTGTMEERLRRMYGYTGKTIVTWKAVSAFSASGNPEEPEALKPHAGKFRIFYVSHYYPHKGLETLADTFKEHADRLAGCVAFITIDGKQHPLAARLLDRIAGEKLGDRIVNVGPVAQKDLEGYYRHSDALVMPTRLESFSGTYLEAMHFSLPILTSDLDFAREVCADAALYFDPWKTESIRDAMLKIRNTPDLAAELREKGTTRLKEVHTTWDLIVERIMAEIAAVGTKR